MPEDLTNCFACGRALDPEAEAYATYGPAGNTIGFCGKTCHAKYAHPAEAFHTCDLKGCEKRPGVAEMLVPAVGKADEFVFSFCTDEHLIEWDKQRRGFV